MSALKYWLWLTELRGLTQPGPPGAAGAILAPRRTSITPTPEEMLLTEGITREQAAALEDKDLLRRGPDPGGLPAAGPAAS